VSRRSDMGPTCDDAHHCITCSDDGVPERVLAVDEARGLALCEAQDGAHESVEIALVAPVAVGDTVLVHAGTALARLTEDVVA
jgi:hydrogenase assembly chaperone HypC/HupF